MWLALLSLIGIFIAAYLTLYKLGYVGTLICTGSHGCETVQTSSYSKFLGIPVAAWGLGYYLTVFLLAIVSIQDRFADSQRLPLVLMLLTGWGAVFSGYLTFLEAGPIGAWCQWCIGSAITAALLFIIAVMEWKASRSA